ncbi:ComEC/Rec2 family competence protein [Chitinophaga japonensis]
MQYALNRLRGILIYCLLLGGGGLLVSVKDIRHHPAYAGKALQGEDSLLVRLQEPLQERPRSWKSIATIEALLRNGKRLPVKGRTLLYFQKDSTAAALQCGEALLLCATLRPVGNTGNPGAFDYRQYCARRQIFHQAYVRSGHWKRSGECNGMVDRWLLQARAWCVHTLQQYVGGGQASALAAALLIGYRYDLDKDMVQAYTNAGVVHIIAISGMHLALIYATLLWLLQWWPAHRFSNIIKAAIIISLLWAFACVTGAAASILRAAVMFTAIAIGQLVLNRYTSTYNTLAASAFLLLCYDPWLLLDAGFQLSYLAVLGILLCYRPLYDLWVIRNKWLSRCWAAMAVTLAAQVFTLPVCLYYFHQFPNLFLPANLLIVTLSTIILYGLILLLLLSPLPAAAHYTGAAVTWLISCMNRLVLFIESLPYAVTENIPMPGYATVCAYVIIAALMGAWLARWKRGWHLALYAALLWAALYAVATVRNCNRRQLVIYNVPGYTAMDVVAGRHCRFAGDTALLRNAALRKRYLQPARLLYGAKDATLPALQQQEGFISIGRKRLVVVDSTWRACAPVKKFCTDYILLSHHPRLSIMQLKDMFDFKMIIFDASNPFWQVQQWKSECSVLTLRCFSVPDQGAYLINF